MAKAFYGSRFSANMTRTPEGFLVCHNVPLARTGVQQYLGSEVNCPDKAIVEVYRNESEVFDQATLASFEGKPVTDEHPSRFVEPSNATAYTRGTCQNVRRGMGDESDLIVADLIIYDAVLISEIEAGKREISAGYYCEYKPFKEGLEQTNIVCNHIAVVANGRAGARVAIKDSQVIKKKGRKSMAKKKQSIWNRMFDAFVKDEDTTTEELREAAEALADKEKETDADEVEENVATDEEIKAAINDALSPVLSRLRRLEAASLVKDEEPNDLEKLEDELTEGIEESTDDDGEESVTVDPEDITEDEEGEEQQTEDKAIALKIFRQMKPIICSMKGQERVQATDALRSALEPYMKNKVKNKTAATGRSYADLNRRKTTDSKAEAGNFGEACRKFNPHYKGGK